MRRLFLKKLFFRIGQVSGLCCGMSPLFLMFGINAHNTEQFVHNWFVFLYVSFIVSIVSLTVMQMIDE